MPSPLAIELPAFLIGLLFGSFLNVCISRLPFHESIWKPRSHCPRCLHIIRWYDNIPILSWLLLGTRCRDCKARISWRYPVVELAYAVWLLAEVHALIVVFTGTISAIDTADHMPHPAGMPTIQFDWAAAAPQTIAVGLAMAILGFLLIGLLVMDWQNHTLPDAFTLTGTAIGFFLVCVQAIFLAPGQADITLNPTHSMRMSSPGSFVAKGNVFLTGPEHLVFGRVLAILAAAAFPFLIRAAYKAVRKKEGLGLGDVKLMAMIAAFLGFWPALLAFFLGCILIFPYALTLLALKRADRATQLPFGSFLCVGGLLAAVFGSPLIDWYKTFL